nr:hypothetical protein Ade03nite_47110 [Actinoplanes derwentensis]
MGSEDGEEGFGDGLDVPGDESDGGDRGVHEDDVAAGQAEVAQVGGEGGGGVWQVLCHRDSVRRR